MIMRETTIGRMIVALVLGGVAMKTTIGRRGKMEHGRMTSRRTAIKTKGRARSQSSMKIQSCLSAIFWDAVSFAAVSSSVSSMNLGMLKAPLSPTRLG